jgi:hypothetical protein
MDNDFSEKEKAQAQVLVNQMMDGGKTEARLNAIAEELAALADKDKEDSGFILLVNCGTLGKTFGAMAGKPSTFCVMLDTAMDGAEVLESSARRVLAKRAVFGLMDRLAGKEPKARPDEDDDDD